MLFKPEIIIVYKLFNNNIIITFKKDCLKNLIKINK